MVKQIENDKCSLLNQLITVFLCYSCSVSNAVWFGNCMQNIIMLWFFIRDPSWLEWLKRVDGIICVIVTGSLSCYTVYPTVFISCMFKKLKPIYILWRKLWINLMLCFLQACDIVFCYNFTKLNAFHGELELCAKGGKNMILKYC